MGFIDILNKIFPPKEDDGHKDVSRNDPCYCGSGKKYKACHMASDQRKRAQGRR
ncbi:SEC-C domain-containing protein [bacterium]|nr:SEC-C domain-containing protein [bacterium]